MHARLTHGIPEYNALTDKHLKSYDFFTFVSPDQMQKSGLLKKEQDKLEVVQSPSKYLFYGEQPDGDASTRPTTAARSAAARARQAAAADRLRKVEEARQTAIKRAAKTNPPDPGHTSALRVVLSNPNLLLQRQATLRGRLNAVETTKSRQRKSRSPQSVRQRSDSASSMDSFASEMSELDAWTRGKAPGSDAMVQAHAALNKSLAPLHRPKTAPGGHTDPLDSSAPSFTGPGAVSFVPPDEAILREPPATTKVAKRQQLQRRMDALPGIKLQLNVMDSQLVSMANDIRSSVRSSDVLIANEFERLRAQLAAREAELRNLLDEWAQEAIRDVARTSQRVNGARSVLSLAEDNGLAALEVPEAANSAEQFAALSATQFQQAFSMLSGLMGTPVRRCYAKVGFVEAATIDKALADYGSLMVAQAEDSQAASWYLPPASSNSNNRVGSAAPRPSNTTAGDSRSRD